MRRSLTSFGMLVILTACGVAPSVEIHPLPIPRSVSEDTHSLRATLNGVWDVREPPIEVTFDLDARRVIIKHKGLPIQQTWPLTAEREDSESVFLRGPKTSGGGAIKIHVITDDVVQWQSMTQETLWTLTRK